MLIAINKQFRSQFYFILDPTRVIEPAHPINGLIGDLFRKAISLEKVTVSSYDFYKVLETQAPQLKRFAVVGFKGMPVYEMNPRMTTRILDDIGRNFKQLECLILGEFLNPKFSWGQHQFRTLADQTDLDQWYTELVSQVSRVVPGLQQLCIRAQPSVYCRGIRKPGEPNMTVTWQTDQVETLDEFDNFFV
ncbi:hypothetical protein IL306_006632 [Fusarium sp. DS 682]|nr:hypothetical protein IL306_006632 [Fusarium sp. DS 682]